MAARPDPARARRRGLRRARRSRRARGCARSRCCSPTSTARATAVRAGWVPAEALSSSLRYRLATVGAPPPPRWLTSYAVDVVALADGIVAHRAGPRRHADGRRLRADRPLRRWRGSPPSCSGRRAAATWRRSAASPPTLRHALAATSAVPSPRIVAVQRRRSTTPAYVEHSSLARVLGFHLVEAPDLVVRKGRAVAAHARRPRPDRRRLPAARRRRRRPDRGQRDAARRACPGCCSPRREGGVVLANAHGCGRRSRIPRCAPFWPAAVEGADGHAPRSATPRRRRRAGDGPGVPARAGSARRSVVVRLHAVAGPDGITVMAGGNGRVLATATTRAGRRLGWPRTCGCSAPTGRAPIVVAPLPQVDLVSSVPTRAADALFWLGRAAERAEAIAKTARVVASRRQTRTRRWPTFDGGRWARRMAHVLRVVRGAPLDAEPPRRPARSSCSTPSSWRRRAP